MQKCERTVQSALSFFLLFSKYFKKKKKEKKKKNMRKKTHSPRQQTRHCFKTISVTVTVQTGVQWERERKKSRDTEVRLAHWVLQSTNFISHWWKVASGKMEITVRVVSCLLGTCFVIDYRRVPVESKVLINEREKKRGESGTGNWLFVTSWVFTVTAMLTSVITTSSRHCPH